MKSINVELAIRYLTVVLLLCGCSKNNVTVAHVDSAHFIHFSDAHTAEHSVQDWDDQSGEIWQKGANVRIEKQDGKVFIQTGQFEYEYKNGDQRGLRTLVASKDYKSLNPIGDALTNASEIQRNGKAIGSEEMDGIRCQHFESEQSGWGEKAKYELWLSISNQFPVKIIQKIEDGVFTSTYSNVEINVALPESLFSPPTNIIWIDTEGSLRI